MDTRIKTFQLSFAIHALIFAAFIWYGKSIPEMERLIMVDLGDAKGVEAAVKKTKGEGKKKERATERSRQDVPAKEQEQAAVSQLQERVPLLAEDTPVETANVGWASPTDNRQAQPALPSDPVETGRWPISDVPPGPLYKEGGGHGAGDAAGSDKGGDILGNAKNIYIKEHFAYIRDTIMKNLTYPAAARRMGWEGKVVVSFVVNEDGHVSDIKVVEGSGFGILDRNAVETVKKSSPFPKPPGRAELVMPIVYKML